MKSLIGFLLLYTFISKAQTPTVGLIQNDAGTYDGYTLFTPLACPANNCGTYLLNNCGEIVHQWPTTASAGLSSVLLPDGKLLRPYAIPHPFINAGGVGGGIQLFDFDGNLLWDYILTDSIQTQHHDVVAMPNGNILALVWAYKDSTECVNRGRNPAHLTSGGIWSDKLIEIRPIFPDSGEIVWEWDSWDHLVQEFDGSKPQYAPPSNHPELYDINYYGWSLDGADWLHTNAIDYNPALDQIAMSSRYFHEVYILDHSTSTAQAAGHTGGNSGKGGDIIYRWGNAEAYGKDLYVNRKLFAQHNVHWIKDGLTDAGKLMIFNNGTERTPVEYSSVDIIDPNPDVNGNYTLDVNGRYGPDSAEWSYVAPNPTDFHSQYIAGAERLPNGNTIICDGTHGTIFEIDVAKNVVWKYVSPVTYGGILSQGSSVPPFAIHGTSNWVFRAPKYGANYSAFNGHTLTGYGYVEQNPDPTICPAVSIAEINKSASVSVFPNPTDSKISIKTTEQVKVNSIGLQNVFGQVLPIQFEPKEKDLIEVDLSTLPAGIYFLQVSDQQVRIIKTN